MLCLELGNDPHTETCMFDCFFQKESILFYDVYIECFNKNFTKRSRVNSDFSCVKIIELRNKSVT